MKKVRMTIKIYLMVLVTLTAMSCKDASQEKEVSEPMSSEMYQEDSDNQGGSGKMMAENAGNNATNTIIDNYLQLKNALVADDQEAAAQAGGKLVDEFENFDKSNYSSEEQQELTDIIEDAKEHAEHIAESAIDHQREHFDILSKDVIDMIAITGTNKKLYQDFCPMYNNNKGAQWLSATKEIKNPYFGSKMMDCGNIQKEIN
ncbi:MULTISPECIES: DUF3347 domain-containing protein [Christiangramia]|uniref:DUF3347 domain-containing protein n=2 Tax=Christiangramia forsetii TaxID=411153 RepID=A0M0S3_CHRFK|nr:MULTISPECIES: DUF3347 domain-containing protein [Christiangramia]GGG43292.1 hypothetical protein GCM10011532_29120 [Christiangramia forsetii]CAL66218.1 conserved hypothetical protein, secreted [Christiangramia forsetii KT0803]